MMRVFLSACLLVVALTRPVSAQQDPLAGSLDAIETRLAEVERDLAGYEGGAIRDILLLRRQTLALTRDMITLRLTGEATGASEDLRLPTRTPDPARAAQLAGEIAAAEARVETARREAEGTGGLLRLSALAAYHAEQLGLTRLRLAWFEAEYGIALPTPDAAAPAAPPPEVASATAPAPEQPTDPWVDPRFPQIDYARPAFRQLHQEGFEVSGWWGISRERAPLDDSLSITAINVAEFSTSGYGDNPSLIVSCREGTPALIYDTDDYLLTNIRSNSIEVTFRIGDNPAETQQWSKLTTGEGAGLFGDRAIALMRRIYDADRIFLRLVERNGQTHDALFPLDGGPAAYDAAADACGFSTLSLSRDDYLALQTALTRAGHDPGTPDGNWGPASRQAMRGFQAANGLPETGQPDRASIALLRGEPQ